MTQNRSILIGLLVLVSYLLPCKIYAQNNLYVPGEFIIQTDGTSGNKILKDIFRTDRRQKAAPTMQVLSSDMGFYTINFDPGKINENDLMSKLNSNPNILAAQRNHYLKSRRKPDDPRYEEQWPFYNNDSVDNDIMVEKAWDITTGGMINNHDIVIAVIDDGFQVEHPDLVGNIYINTNETPNNGIDDDNNGYVDDYRGWNFETNNDSLNTGDHGEPVAGVIGAKGNNGIGIAGINWDVKILPLLLDEKFTDAGLLASYIYAYKLRKKFNDTQGAEGAFVAVTNSSWGAEGYFPDEFPVWCNFYDSLSTAGILNCVATSNNTINVDEDGDIPSLCSSESVIVVTNTNRDRDLVGAFGPVNVDIAAPGERILTLKDEGYGYESGTSFSTPVVSGVLGLMYSIPGPEIFQAALAQPEQTALTMKSILMDSYDTVPAMEGKIRSPGIINAWQAVNNTMSYFLAQDIEYCPIDSLQASPFYLDSLIIGTDTIASGDNRGYRPQDVLVDSLEQGRFIPTAIISSTDNDSLDFVLWMDSNRDSIFSENERLISDRQIGQWEGQFFMPESVDSGYYQMRAGVLAPTDSINPCGTKIPNYEYEDYTVYVKLNPLLCQDPPTVDTIMTGPNHLQIMWTRVDSSVAYVFRYRKQGESEWEDEMVDTAKMFTLEDLDECTPYEFQVRSVCFYDTSAYTPVAVFFTACKSSNENHEFTNRISLYPNPGVNGHITIDFGNISEPINTTNVSIRLYSMEGRLIKDEQQHSMTNERVRLHWPDIPGGMYWVRISVGDIFAVKKWVVH